VPDHSKDTLRFLKVGSAYASGYDNLPRFLGITVGSYEECYKRYKQHYDAIKEVFVNAKNKILSKNKLLSNAYAVIKELEDIGHSVSMMKVKTSSPVSVEKIVNRLNVLIKKIAQGSK
jgi:hypothetical protein